MSKKRRNSKTARRSSKRTKTGPVRRAAIMDWTLQPFIKRVFKSHPYVKCVAMLVAQFWNDEADDAVHVMFLYSANRDIDLDAAFASYDGEEYQDGGEYYGADDLTNLPNLRGGQETFCSLWEGRRSEGPHAWNPNRNAIPAFAAFCKEGCHQGMNASEAFTSYALFRPGEDVEIVGKMLRPWLDGLEGVRSGGSGV